MVTGLLCGLMIGLGIAVPVSAIIFRAAIGLTNKVLGPGQRETADVYPVESSVAFSEPDPANPYSSPARMSVAVDPDTLVVPEPHFGRACAIVFVAMLFSFLANFLIGLAGGEIPQVILIPLNLAVGFGVHCKIYEMMIPTTFGRAALIYLFQFLISIVIGAAFVGVIFALRTAAA